MVVWWIPFWSFSFLFPSFLSFYSVVLYACEFSCIVYSHTLHRGLCSDTYPDEMCRSSTHVEQPTPPLLYNLNTDPSEQYGLDPTENMDIIKKITMVKYVLHLLNSILRCNHIYLSTLDVYVLLFIIT